MTSRGSPRCAIGQSSSFINVPTIWRVGTTSRSSGTNAADLGDRRSPSALAGGSQSACNSVGSVRIGPIDGALYIASDEGGDVYRAGIKKN